MVDRSEPEHTVFRQTGLGSSGTGTASRGETMVAAQIWCGSARGPPTRIVGREELQVVAQIASSIREGALEWTVMTRPFYTTEEETPLPLCAFASRFLTQRSFAANGLAYGSCVWCGDGAFGTSCESYRSRLR